MLIKSHTFLLKLRLPSLTSVLRWSKYGTHRDFSALDNTRSFGKMASRSPCTRPLFFEPSFLTGYTLPNRISSPLNPSLTGRSVSSHWLSHMHPNWSEFHRWLASSLFFQKKLCCCPWLLGIFYHSLWWINLSGSRLGSPTYKLFLESSCRKKLSLWYALS